MLFSEHYKPYTPVGESEAMWFAYTTGKEGLQLHCPQFGPDRTEPVGPGFGPLSGQTGPISTGPRSIR